MMKITLKSSTGGTFATVTNWQDANIAAKAILKKQMWSDLYYTIVFSDGFEVTGSIDLEPISFHLPHQKTVITTHLQTFWTNVSRQTPGRYGLTAADISFANQLLTYFNF